MQPSAGHIFSGLTSRVFWCAYIFWMGQHLGASDLGLALMSLAAAWAISILINPLEMRRHSSLPEDLEEWHATLVRLFLRWLLYCSGLTALLVADLPAAHFSSPQYAIVIGGLPLALAIRSLGRRLRRQERRRPPNFDSAYPVLVLTLSLLTNHFGSFTVGASLFLHLLSLLTLILIDFWQLSEFEGKPPKTIKARQHRLMRAVEAGEFLLRYLDLLILPFILLEPKLAVPYLLAKALAEVVGWVLNVLERRVESQFHVGGLVGSRNPALRASAARINLGFLLVGSSAMIAVLGLAGLGATQVRAVDPIFLSVLFWLVMGQGAPALVGATRLFMSNGHALQARATFAGTTILAALCLVVSFHEHDPTVVAWLLGSCQLTYAAVCAIFLGINNGIWPGISAVLYARVKLL